MQVTIKKYKVQDLKSITNGLHSIDKSFTDKNFIKINDNELEFMFDNKYLQALMNLVSQHNNGGKAKFITKI